MIVILSEVEESTLYDAKPPVRPPSDRSAFLSKGDYLHTLSLLDEEGYDKGPTIPFAPQENHIDPPKWSYRTRRPRNPA